MTIDQFLAEMRAKGYGEDVLTFDPETRTVQAFSRHNPTLTWSRSGSQVDQILAGHKQANETGIFVSTFIDQPAVEIPDGPSADLRDLVKTNTEAGRFDIGVEQRKTSILIDREARRQIAVEEMGLGDLSERWLTLDALEMLEPPSWIVDQKVPAHSVGYITGRDGTYKTFLALDFALTLAAQGEPVVYLVGEGANGFGRRIGAWLYHHKADRATVAKNLIVRNGTVNLFAQGPDFDDLVERVTEVKPRLVVVDTLARSMAGAEENSNSDMGLVTKALDRLKEASDGTVLVIAHTDKGNNDARGASAIEDNADFVLKNDEKNGEIRVSVEKMKDGSRGHRFDYVAKAVGDSVVLVPPTQMEVKVVASSHDLDNRVMVLLKSFAANDLGASLPTLVSELKNDPVGETRDRITKHSVSDVLKTLRNEGYVRRSPEVGNTNVQFYATPKQWRPASDLFEEAS